MKRLKIFILIFFVTLSVPVAYLVLQTYRGLEQEEVGKLRYFAETLFDEMEKDLASIVLEEESRPIDEYNYQSIPSGLVPRSTDAVPSPLSKLSEKPYVLGYFQIEFGEREVESITPDDILKFLTELTANAKPTTKRLRYSNIKSFFDQRFGNLDGIHRTKDLALGTGLGPNGQTHFL